MIKINDILNFRLLILSLGLVIGLGIVAQPMVENYIDCKSLCKAAPDDSHPENSSSDEEKNESDTKFSSFEAVTSAVHIDVSPTNLVTEEISIDKNPARITFAEMVRKVPRKLLKVLFNRIIAPNAP